MGDKTLAPLFSTVWRQYNASRRGIAEPLATRLMISRRIATQIRELVRGVEWLRGQDLDLCAQRPMGPDAYALGT
jgi:hypothetical protein